MQLLTQRARRQARWRRPSNRAGFALVVTVSLMVLLTVVALGLLSLSAITLRVGRAGAAQAEARSNARLAALLALGELQKLAGPDTRITAPGVAFGEEESAQAGGGPVTGVWRSWEGHDRDRGYIGRPKAPDYDQKDVLGSTSSADEEGRFLGYLVSRNSDGEWDPGSPPDLSDGEVTLLGSSSVGDDRSDQVWVDPVRLDDGSGSYAWWVSGENQKAGLGVGSEPDHPAEWAGRLASGDYPDAGTFHLTELEDLPKAVSRASLDLLPADPPDADSEPVSRRHFHDLTRWSRGLLTNAAAGGFKRDLSLLTERWDRLRGSRFPFYTTRPGEESEVSLQVGGEQRFIYPWAQTANADKYGSNFGPVVPWDALKDFCLQYRQISNSTPGGHVTIPQYATGKPDVSVTRVRRYPQVARMHFSYAYSSIRDPEDPEQLTACMVVNPVITMWNPYNVELTVDNMYLQTFEATPIRLEITVGSRSFKPIPLSYLMFAHQDVNKRIKQRYSMGGPHTFKPGETMVFSHKGDEPVNKVRSGGVPMEPGYRTHGGMRFTKIVAVHTGNNNNPWEMTAVKGGPGTVFKAKVDLDAGTNHSKTKDVRGYYWNLYGNNQGKIGYHRLEIEEEVVNQEKFWHELKDLRTTTLGEAAAESQVFVSSQFGFRMATDSNIKSKGMLQANPLTFRTEYSVQHGYLYKGGNIPHGFRNPVNSPFDMNFLAHSSWDDSLLPNADPLTKRGFIVSGVDSSAGLHRCVMVELPLRPLRSLPELQHMDLRNENKAPPYAANIIGNSSACPMVAPDECFIPYSSETRRILQYDDSYVANHVLFDDWFFSSIAPHTSPWSKRPRRSLEGVYEDFLAGDAPLPNARYVPASPVPKGQAAEVTDQHLDGDDAWRTIAAELEIDGMFNVNSLSTGAWSAMLRNLRNAEVPVLSESGDTMSVKLVGSNDSTPVARSTVAGDFEAGGVASDAGFFPEASEFAGFRTLTDGQIERLAEEIVGQVRKRGPFLSLSEFVNRQLTGDYDKDLALAGTIQAALDQLAKLAGDDNPYRVLQALSGEVTGAQDFGSVESADYQFPEAALGSTAFGVPGWIRQADILRSLAPVISVRDDSFVIRAYGDSRNPAGEIVARAWCEMTVQRKAEYVDPADDPTVLPAEQSLDSAVNHRFGRRFRVVSFRWLSPEEV